jgi:hypothetical protein
LTGKGDSILFIMQMQNNNNTMDLNIKWQRYGGDWINE